jgi:radical SAM protein with 4Fe4S-binding SPASM domain
MNEKTSTYIKQKSLLEIRQARPNQKKVLLRIKKVWEELGDSSFPLDQVNILQKACSDLINPDEETWESKFQVKDYILREIEQIAEKDLTRYLFYRYRYEMFPRKKTVDKFPPCLQIEPTSICNYRCVFCYQVDKEFTNPKMGHMGSMSIELFKKLIDQAEGSCEAITLSSRGEPLMNRQFEDMLDYVKGKFLGLKINTNAWFLDEEKAHAILQAEPNTVVFSADAAHEPLYSRLRVNGKLERVLKNIQMFKSIRDRDYPDASTITRVSGVKFLEEQNLNELETFWHGLVDQVAFVQYNPWENTYEKPINDIESPCTDLWRRMFVWWDGRVNPCDIDYKSTLSVGNANDEKLSDIWTGEKYTALRTAHLSSKRNTVVPCSQCTFV